MSGSGPLPWLAFAGTEIANAARTLSYLRRGLANTQQGHWELGPGDVCSVLYRGGGGNPTPGKFLSPGADPAPWYDPTEPGSATFLGLVLLDIQGYDSTIYRTVSNRLGGLGGATFSKQHRRPRAWKFRGALVSADDAGAEYGLRWLTSALQAGCDGCALSSLSVRLACPPDNASNDSLGLWTSYDAALTDGPNEVEPWSPRRQAADADVLAGCRDYVIVEFTLTAGNPFLYKPPVKCFGFTLTQNLVCNDICTFLFGQPGDAHCCVVTPPPRGTMGAIFTLHSAGGIGSLLLEAYAGCPGSSGGSSGSGSSGSGGSGASTLRTRMQLSGVPAATTVVVDAAQHKITATDAAGGVTDATSLLVLPPDQAIPWLEVRDCDDVTCLCVRTTEPCAAGSVDVTLQTQEREA